MRGGLHRRVPRVERPPPPTTIVVAIWWLVFRLEFGAGMIKIRGGREWRDLTALMYHHETQPMPNPFSRQAHLLPTWFHRGEVLGNHFAQLVVPFLLFAPPPVAGRAAIVGRDASSSSPSSGWCSRATSRGSTGSTFVLALRGRLDRLARASAADSRRPRH